MTGHKEENIESHKAAVNLQTANNCDILNVEIAVNEIPKSTLLVKFAQFLALVSASVGFFAAPAVAMGPASAPRFSTVLATEGPGEMQRTGCSPDLIQTKGLQVLSVCVGDGGHFLPDQNMFYGQLVTLRNITGWQIVRDQGNNRLGITIEGEDSNDRVVRIKDAISLEDLALATAEVADSVIAGKTIVPLDSVSFLGRECQVLATKVPASCPHPNSQKTKAVGPYARGLTQSLTTTEYTEGLALFCKDLDPAYRIEPISCQGREPIKNLQ